MYWSTDDIYNLSLFSDVMLCDRFLLLLIFFHLKYKTAERTFSAEHVFQSVREWIVHKGSADPSYTAQKLV